MPHLQSRFPDIRAVVWFDIDKERHWQVNSSEASLQAFRRMAADPYVQHWLLNSQATRSCCARWRA
ncbi:MAG: hypothetical protein WBB07_05675 [Mycobacterium sp.]